MIRQQQQGDSQHNASIRAAVGRASKKVERNTFRKHTWVESMKVMEVKRKTERKKGKAHVYTSLRTTQSIESSPRAFLVPLKVNCKLARPDPD